MGELGGVFVPLKECKLEILIREEEYTCGLSHALEALSEILLHYVG